MTLDVSTTYLPAEVGWHNWGKFFTDVDVWRPVVERICRGTGITPANRVETGYPGSCAVFVVDGQVVVKLFPPLFPKDFGKEREVYRLLNGRLPHLPRLLADGIYHDRIDWPYLALQFCPGEPIRELYTAISFENKLGLAPELGQMIRTLHDTPVANVSHFDPHPEVWRQFLGQRRAGCLAELRQTTSLPQSVLVEIEPFLDSVTLLPPEFEPVLIHADLTEDHLLLVQRDGAWQISALIDWADAEVGTPEYEWVALWFGLCNRDADMFKEIWRAYDPALSIDEAFRRRMMAYTFLHRFGADIIAHILEKDGNPPIHTLTELMDWLWPPTLCFA